jgi:hypothetical protein
MASYYGTINGANTYFTERLFTEAWDNANGDDRLAALIQGTRVIDALNYKGVKASVYDIKYDADDDLVSPAPTRDAIIAADVSQALEFPRGKDDTVPDEIEWANYEIAIALLEGFDPNTAGDELRVVKQTYASVGTTYAEDDASMEFLLYGIPNGTVWRWLYPRLDFDRLLHIRRVS